jgi:hypothetical protein
MNKQMTKIKLHMHLVDVVCVSAGARLLHVIRGSYFRSSTNDPRKYTIHTKASWQRAKDARIRSEFLRSSHGLNRRESFTVFTKIGINWPLTFTNQAFCR